VICVYDWTQQNDYNTFGAAVLNPSSCVTRQIGGGGYTLKMTHPVDREGKYKLLVNGNIIKAPVPEEEIENAYAGRDMWIYYTAGETALRDDPSEPRSVSYDEWNGSNIYVVGSKATFSRKNWQCIYFDDSSGQRFIPPDDSPWWKEIPGKTGGGTVVASLPAGTKLIWVSGSYSDTWWKMCTLGGVEGWIKQSDLTGEEHREQDEIQPVRITEQLFRIKRITDQTEHEISLEAEHVSYDANGLLIQKAEIAKATPATAIWMMQEGLYEPYEDGTISTNLTDTDSGTYTQTIKGKSLIWALLDPSSGIVAKFDAALKRNNWDIYVLKKQNTDRGFYIRYGVNAKGIHWDRDAKDVVTRIIPVAKDENGNDFYLTNLYVDSPLISAYPRIRMQQLSVNGQVGKDDGSGTDTPWTESTLRAEMEAKAQEKYDNEHVDQEKVEVTVDFLMLGYTEEYREVRRLEQVAMYDIVHAVNPRVGLDAALRVVEIEWDAIRKRITGIKLSNIADQARKSVAGYMMTDQSVTEDKIAMQTMTDIVEAAADRAIRILG